MSIISANRSSQTATSFDAQEHEIEHWLSTKLNSDWISERIANQLTPEVVDTFSNQYERMKFLETPIKLRLLLGCLSLKKKALSDMGASYKTLFEKSTNDEQEDEWVRVISNVLAPFPSDNYLKTTVSDMQDEKGASIVNSFSEAIQRLSKVQPAPTPHNHFKTKFNPSEINEPIIFFEQKASAPTVDNVNNDPTRKKKPVPINSSLNHSAKPAARKLSSGAPPAFTKPTPGSTSSAVKPATNLPSKPPTPSAVKPIPSTITSNITPRQTVQPRVAKQIVHEEAMLKMKEQGDKERKRANYIRSDKDPDKERKKVERIQAKEKKDLEKEEKKKVREQEKKRKLEETEQKEQQRKRVKETKPLINPQQPNMPGPQLPGFANRVGNPFGAMPSPVNSPFGLGMMPFSPVGPGGIQFNLINNPTTPTTHNKMSQMLQEVLQSPSSMNGTPTSFTPTGNVPLPPNYMFNSQSPIKPPPFMFFPNHPQSQPQQQPLVSPTGAQMTNLLQPFSPQQQPPQSFNPPPQQYTAPAPQPQQSPMTSQQKQVEDYLDNKLLKGCNKVSQQTRNKILNFLSGKIEGSGKHEQELIHEEYKKDGDSPEEVLHQIYFQMDYTNKTWKKFLKKITNTNSVPTDPTTT
ncbi:negative elongation factor A [Acrasis kona]|uniref:Negative elongation factor A n=1 Tax=Acrasis kona TaxID=1008807 RepID=A0AAW2ZIF6_9EUKA